MELAHLVGKEVTLENAEGLFHGTIAAAAEHTICLKSVFEDRDGWRKTWDRVINTSEPHQVKIQLVKEERC